MNDGSMTHRVRAAAAGCATGLALGIDPRLDQVPDFFRRELAHRGTRSFLEVYGCSLVDAAAGLVPAIKPQMAFFEMHGADGFEALRATCVYAARRGLLVVLDGKRGDISTTMAAYGAMAFDLMGADALTVTPYMGLDVILPLLPWLKSGKGVYMVWITSNQSGAAVQDLTVASPSVSGDAGRRSSVAGRLLDLFGGHLDRQGLLGALGLVLGATRLAGLPAELDRYLARISLLLPGVGAQGGGVTEELLTLGGRAGSMLVPQSRSLTDWDPEWKDWTGLCHAVRNRILAAAPAVPVGKSLA